MAEKGRMKFVVPGDEPIQIQDSPHLARLEPYGDLAVYKDRPASMEEQLRRVENAEVIINTRGGGQVVPARPPSRCPICG